MSKVDRNKSHQFGVVFVKRTSLSFGKKLCAGLTNVLGNWCRFIARKLKHFGSSGHDECSTYGKYLFFALGK